MAGCWPKFVHAEERPSFIRNKRLIITLQQPRYASSYKDPVSQRLARPILEPRTNVVVLDSRLTVSGEDL